MTHSQADHIVACLDCPQHVQAVLDASIWASKRLHAPLTLLHTHADSLSVADYQQCLTSHPVQTGTLSDSPDKTLPADLLQSDPYLALLSHSQHYCQHWLSQTSIDIQYREDSWLHSLEAIENRAQLLVIGHQVTCKTTLDKLIRHSGCPILVTHAPFLPATTALFAFDDRPTCHKLLDWLCASTLLRTMTVHIVMVATDSESHQEALRSAYARLVQAGIKCKKTLINPEATVGSVAETLQHYQDEHHLGMMISGAFGQSRLKKLFKGSDTKQLLSCVTTPYLLYPSD